MVSLGVGNIGSPFTGYLTNKKWVFNEEFNRLMVEFQQVKILSREIPLKLSSVNMNYSCILLILRYVHDRSEKLKIPVKK